MAWSKEWPVVAGAIDWPKITGLDLGTGEKVVLTTFENGEIKHTDVTKEYNNKVPTHDPYTNPNALIYYECGCGAILDPGTKSFAGLNNHASEKGWKIRFRKTGYTPYCIKCWESVE